MDLNYAAGRTGLPGRSPHLARANLPADLQHKVTEGQELTKDDYLRWHKILARKGWVAPSWPPEWGGTGWDITRRYIFEEECGLAARPDGDLVRCGHVCARCC